MDNWANLRKNRQKWRWLYCTFTATAHNSRVTMLNTHCHTAMVLGYTTTRWTSGSTRSVVAPESKWRAPPRLIVSRFGTLSTITKPRAMAHVQPTSSPRPATRWQVFLFQQWVLTPILQSSDNSQARGSYDMPTPKKPLMSLVCRSACSPTRQGACRVKILPV